MVRIMISRTKLRATVLTTAINKKLRYRRDSAHLRSLRLTRSLILMPVESPYETSY